jgi:hypothetical protein
VNDTDFIKLDIPTRLNAEEMGKRLASGRTAPRYVKVIEEMTAEAREIARPTAIYKVSKVLKNDGHKIDIDGVVFTSKVLSKLLEGQDTVIPFIATGGKELMEIASTPGDMMKQFYLDTIKTFVVADAVNYLKDYVQQKHLLSKVALMNPGEIEDWSIMEQQPLFQLFNGEEKSLGVRLTEGGVMYPIKSRSGIIFRNDTGFESCQLCLNARCPGRRVAFNPKLYEYYLGKPAKVTK